MADVRRFTRREMRDARAAGRNPARRRAAAMVERRRIEKVWDAGLRAEYAALVLHIGRTHGMYYGLELVGAVVPAGDAECEPEAPPPAADDPGPPPEPPAHLVETLTAPGAPQPRRGRRARPAPVTA